MTVYMIQKSGDETQVKIGTTRNMSARLLQLTGVFGAIDLIGTMPGDEPVEKMLHRLFDADRVEGEWFKRSEAVDNFVAENFKVSVKRYVPKQRGWKSSHEEGAVNADKAVAMQLLAKLLSGFPRTMTIAAAIEEVYLQLAEINGAWTRRRVRAMHEGDARRIDLFEVKDMLTLLDIPVAEWGTIITSKDNRGNQ